MQIKSSMWSVCTPQTYFVVSNRTIIQLNAPQTLFDRGLCVIFLFVRVGPSSLQKEKKKMIVCPLESRTCVLETAGSREWVSVVRVINLFEIHSLLISISFASRRVNGERPRRNAIEKARPFLSSTLYYSRRNEWRLICFAITYMTNEIACCLHPPFTHKEHNNFPHTLPPTPMRSIFALPSLPYWMYCLLMVHPY